MKRLLCAMLVCLALPGVVLADFRVATVDVNRILNESKEAQSKKKKLDEMSLEAKKKVEAKKASLKDLEEKLKANKVAEESKEADQFRAQVKELDRMMKDSQEDLKKEFLRSNKELTDKTLVLIKRYASGNNIDVVFDHSEQMRGPVIFAGAINDITDPIIKEMNR